MEPAHLLLRPRVIAVLGLAGLAIGALSLMAFPAVAPYAFLLALFASLGGLALYWRDYVRLFRTRRLDENSPAELVMPLLLACSVAAFGYVVWPRPEISFQKFALFYVQTGDKDTYQFGIVTKFFNEGSESYRTNTLRFDTGTFSINPRGSWTIQRLTAFPVQVNLVFDNYVKANDVSYFKMLLPVFVQMKVLYGGDPPELLLSGQWSLVLDKATEKLSPLGYATFPGVISQDQWDDLQKPKSKINMEDLDYKPFETTKSP